ncbi:MAG: uroporphyrinogen decarboxylase family protein [Treponema sp.]|jgi:uroporphyrinogen decarboxylase|nr:uroporphyrinogen decarboxylase family protein [Treponema sp.]
MNMQKWKEDVLKAPVKKAVPILSFPCVQLMGITVKQLISDSALQAEGMKKICERADSFASVSMMDLSVEAEAFGSQIHKSDDEVPTVTGRIIENAKDADMLNVPDVMSGRTGLYINAVKRAAEEIKDRPVLAGVIGPFSLAGRLMDMSEIMANCYDDPDMVNRTLEKTAEFITNYILEFKKAGANGIVMAEPAAGLLSPGLIEEFSSRYVKKITGRVKDNEFLFMYHNCGPNTPLMLPSLTGIGADAYHFGDAVKIKQILEKMPADVIVMGNISPAAQFRNGTPESIYSATTELLRECSVHNNYVVSSGCDIPPMSPWANIDSFFKAVKDFYSC